MMLETGALQQHCGEEGLAQFQIMMPAAKDTVELVDCRYGRQEPFKVLCGKAQS